MAIKCGYCKQHHASVDQVKACAKGAHPSAQVRPAGPTGKVASEKQVNYVRSLAEQREWPEADGPSTRGAVHIIECVLEGKAITGPEASATIDFLKGQPKAKAAKSTTPTIDDGTYAYDGTFYRVVHAVHGSGEQYAKRLHDLGVNAEGKREFKWEYEGKAPLHFLTAAHRLTAEQAKAFGLEYGICVRCARTLTKEESIYVGYGRTCAGHEGWWYPTASELAELMAIEEHGEPEAPTCSICDGYHGSRCPVEEPSYAMYDTP